MAREVAHRHGSGVSEIQESADLIDSIINPATLAAVNEEAISRFAARLRELKREEPTVRSHLSNLRTLLRWAYGQ